MNIGGLRILFIFLLCISAGCANISAPTGGKKDTTPPKLLSVDPRDSLTNVRLTRIELHFDEYVNLGDATKEVQLSPILSIAPTVTSLNKHVVVKIVDSLLDSNTTYRLLFGNAIKDLHEGNVFKNYSYTFSTGSYFDSLRLSGIVINAMTGMTDLQNITVELYSASDNDSAVVRHKPKYVTKAEPDGSFVFKGLPRRVFRIYALKDANDNLIYDGPAPGEQIGFLDNTVVPGDTTAPAISLRVFAEIPDTSANKADSSDTKKEKIGLKQKSAAPVTYSYSVNADTTSADRKTFDVIQPLKVSFGILPLINTDKITLLVDSLGTQNIVRSSMLVDSTQKTLQIKPAKWRENTLYILKLAKGFAKDTAGADLAPSRWVFRTKDEDDYGKIVMHLPAKYRGDMYLLKAMADGDSVYQQPVKDTIVTLRYLKPGKYTFQIIIDKNRNGKWDTGDLLGHKQPEEVIADGEAIPVRAGFEMVEDFVEFKPAGGLKNKAGRTKPVLPVK